MVRERIKIERIVVDGVPQTLENNTVNIGDDMSLGDLQDHLLYTAPDDVDICVEVRVILSNN